MNRFLLLLFTLFTLQTFAQPAGSKSLEFNGSTEFVECGTMNLSFGQITIQGWIKVDNFKPNSPFITSFVGIEQTGAHCALRIGDASIDNDQVQFILYINGVHNKLHTQQKLDENQWYHLAATYDGAQMKIYVNGILDTTRNQTGSITANALFELGRNYADSRILDGQLDDISVFSTALSESTIRSWMCRRINASHPNYGQLVAYYPLDEGSGTTTQDASTNSYNGTFQSTPDWRNSGAPIGHESVYAYGSSFNLGLAHPMGDSAHITSTSGNIEGVHLYRMDSIPYVTSAPGPLTSLDTIRQWGVFPIGTAQYTFDYYYSNNPMANGLDCNLSFASRTDGGATAWSNTPPTASNFVGTYISRDISGRTETCLGISQNGPHSFTYVIDEPLCFGGTDGEATVTVNGGSTPYTYAWSTGSNTAQSGSVASGYATISVTDNFGCSSIDSVFIDQPDSLELYFSITPSICKDTNTGAATAIVFGGTSGGNTFIWETGATTQSISNLAPGSYSATVTDINGCEQSAPALVYSTGPDPKPDLGNDTIICEGSTITLDPGSTGGPFTQYAWSNGNASNSLTVSGGTYSLTVENATGCYGSDTIFISEIEPLQVQLGAPNQSAANSLTLNAGPGFQAYQWSNLATTQSITVVQSGTYWVFATDDNECKSSDTVKVTIFANGLSEFAADAIHVFPNPASKELQVEGLDDQTTCHFRIFSMQGSLVAEGNLNALGIINLENVPNGIYQLELSGSESFMTTLRIIKQ